MKASEDSFKTSMASLAEACTVDFATGLFSYAAVGSTTQLERLGGVDLDDLIPCCDRGRGELPIGPPREPFSRAKNSRKTIKLLGGGGDVGGGHDNIDRQR